MKTNQNPTPHSRLPTPLLLLFSLLLSSCPQPGGSSSGNNQVAPTPKALVVFDNTYGLCTAVVYNDHLRRNEDKIAEVPAGRRSNEIECYPSANEPFYFAYLVSLTGIGDFVLNYVPKNGKDQKSVRLDADTKNIVIIPKIDDTFSSADQLLSSRSSLLLQNASAYSLELHRGRSSIKPDNNSFSPVVNSSEKAFYTLNTSDTFDPGAGAVANYRLLVGADYMEFPDYPDRFEPGHFYSYIYNGDILHEFEIPVKYINIVKKSYTVSFNANGASGTAPAEQTVNAGGVITLPNGNGLSKTGYTFGGWNAAASGGEINYSAGTAYLATGDITLYARWYPLGTVTYTVDFDTNGGNRTASQTVVSGAAAFRPLTPVRTGHEFVNWYSNPGFTNVYDFSKPITGNIILYAKWEIIRYTITFNGNGAIGPVPDARTINAGTAITLPGGNGLSKAGHVFDGWSTDDSGMEAAYNAGSFFTAVGDTTLFAKWKPLSCTITFISNEGSAVPGQTVNYGATAARPADPVRNGYVFDNWYSDPYLTNAYDFSRPVIINMTLYAKFNERGIGIKPPPSVNDIVIEGFPTAPFTVSKNGNGGFLTSMNITLAGSGYSSIQWWVGETDRTSSATNGGRTFSVQASSCTLGEHTLTVIVYKDGIPYSNKIDFTVVM